MKKCKKRSVTLIEIMIVILLIGMIGGALAFNMRGSVDKGRVFKSEQNAAKVYDILMMAYATGEITMEDMTKEQTRISAVKNSPFAKDGEKLLQDAWGEKLEIAVMDGKDDIEVYSIRARKWQNEHKIK